MVWTEKTSLPERAVSLPGTPAQLCARESNSLYGGVRKSCDRWMYLSNLCFRTYDEPNSLSQSA